MKRITKSIAIFLTIASVISVLPVNAFATSKYNVELEIVLEAFEKNSPQKAYLLYIFDRINRGQDINVDGLINEAKNFIELYIDLNLRQSERYQRFLNYYENLDTEKKAEFTSRMSQFLNYYEKLESEDRKLIKRAIEGISYVEKEINTTKFDGIAKDLNQWITTDENDDRGVKLVLGLLIFLAEELDEPILGDKDNNSGKIEIIDLSYLNEKLYEKINEKLKLVGFFSARNINSVEDFINEVENRINSRYGGEVKEFIKEVIRLYPEKNIYEGELRKTLTVNTTNGGSVNIPKITYRVAGDSVTINAIPNSGFTFDGWTVTNNVITLSNTRNVTFAMPNEDLTLRANFSRISTGSGPQIPPPEEDDDTTIPGEDDDLIEGPERPQMPGATLENIEEIIEILGEDLTNILEREESTIEESLEILETLNIVVNEVSEEMTRMEKREAGKSLDKTANILIERYVRAELKEEEGVLVLLEEDVEKALENLDSISKTVQREVDNRIHVNLNDNSEFKISNSTLMLLKDRDSKISIGTNNGKVNIPLNAFKEEVTISVQIETDKDTNEGVINIKASYLDGEVASVETNYEVIVPVDSEKDNNLVPHHLDENGNLVPIKLSKIDRENNTMTISSNNLGSITLKKVEVNLKDMDEAPWAKNQIEFLAARDIIKGMPSGEYAPQEELTRAQFITLVINAFDLNVDGASANFSDLSEDDWHYGTVASANSLGIISGFPNGEFKPNASVSRADMTVIIHRAFELANDKLIKEFDDEIIEEVISTYLDEGDIPSYARESVGLISAAGILSGYPGNLFKAEQNANRAEAAAIIYKLLGNVV